MVQLQKSRRRSQNDKTGQLTLCPLVRNGFGSIAALRSVMPKFDRTPAFEPRVMWEIEHIRRLPLRTQRVVSCPVSGAV